jgi:hypothetical protein
MTAEEAAFASRGPIKLLLMDLEALRTRPNDHDISQPSRGPRPAPASGHMASQAGDSSRAGGLFRDSGCDAVTIREGLVSACSGNEATVDADIGRIDGSFRRAPDLDALVDRLARIEQLLQQLSAAIGRGVGPERFPWWEPAACKKPLVTADDASSGATQKRRLPKGETPATADSDGIHGKDDGTRALATALFDSEKGAADADGAPSAEESQQTPRQSPSAAPSGFKLEAVDHKGGSGGFDTSSPSTGPGSQFPDGDRMRTMYSTSGVGVAALLRWDSAWESMPDVLVQSGASEHLHSEPVLQPQRSSTPQPAAARPGRPAPVRATQSFQEQRRPGGTMLLCGRQVTARGHNGSVSTGVWAHSARPRMSPLLQHQPARAARRGLASSSPARAACAEASDGAQKEAPASLAPGPLATRRSVRHTSMSASSLLAAAFFSDDATVDAQAARGAGGRKTDSASSSPTAAAAAARALRRAPEATLAADDGGALLLATDRNEAGYPGMGGVADGGWPGEVSAEAARRRPWLQVLSDLSRRRSVAAAMHSGVRVS